MSGTKNILKSIMGWSLLTIVGFTALLCGPSSGLAQALLGTAENFAVLGGSTVTNTGSTTIIGDLGVQPGLAVTGFPPGIVTGGTIHTGDAVALQAQSDVTVAYNVLAGLPCDQDLTGLDLGTLTLTQGVYCFSSSAQLTGTLTLDAEGDPDAVFIFQIGSTLTTASNSSVLLINAGQNCNVFWQVGSSATLGTDTEFVGNILALQSITLNTRAEVFGRALARNAAVTMDNNHVAVAVCGVPPTGPTLSKAFSPATIDEGDISTLTITLSNPNTSVADLTAALIDTLPFGVVIAATPNASTTCDGSGVVVATAGGTTVTLPATRSIPAGIGTTAGTCTVTVDVTAPTGDSYINTMPADALQTSNGSNAAPAVATLAVNTPPIGAVTLSKAFSPATIDEGDISTLTITLSNPNTSVADLTATLIDTLPSGVVIAAIPNASTTCDGSGEVVAIAGGTTVTLPTTRSIPAGIGTTAGTCTVAVDVTAPIAGSYFNTIPADALDTSNGSNAAPALATLTVTPPPSSAVTLRKAFSPAAINGGGISTLTITLSNPNTSVADLTAALIDTLPSGMKIAAKPNARTTCGGSGAVVATAGGTTVTLPATRSIPAGVGTTAGTCTVTVSVTAPLAGSYFNTIPADALETSNGSNAAPAVATLAVENFKPQKSKFTFYYENDPQYNDRDAITSSGYLLATGGTFQMPFNKDVTIEFSIDPLRFPPVSPRLLFEQTIPAGTVKSGSTRYRYLSRNSGINELTFEKSGNNVYMYVWVNKVNLLPDLKAMLSQDQYLAFVSEGITSYNITVQIGDQTWSGNAPLKKWNFDGHHYQLALNP